MKSAQKDQNMSLTDEDRKKVTKIYDTDGKCIGFTMSSDNFKKILEKHLND